LKKQLKVKLEVAKFLQDTLEDTALKSKKKRSDDTLTTQFAEFMQKVLFCSTHKRHDFCNIRSLKFYEICRCIS
jgi:hypothetical protein